MTSGFIRVSGNINGSNASGYRVEKPALRQTFNGDNITLSIFCSITPEVILMRQVPQAVTWQGMTMGYHNVAGYDAKTGAKLWGP
jgi:hypothetical protein